MIEDELIKIWQSSSNQERIKFEKSKLMIELQSSLGRLHRWWKYIELVEVIMAIIGILLSIFLVFFIPFVLIKIAIVFIIICAIYLIIKYQGVHRFKPSDLEENYLDYLRNTREYLEVQKKFLETYVHWGILPIYPIMVLFTIGIWENAPIYFIVFINIAVIGIGIYGYFLNKKRVEHEINPRIARIDELIKTLNE
ncbi:hypothetical protein [Flavivirga rizhaonensis]|uniref:Uncharacterized protein n=1 Tax=Flavivirga rizhaonensis TaxID=2559571 RepID=A0A4S1DVN7_9FLAO|nr:hypothetical protein [Flavivirga rizhaonensis]TGV02221.1 hypothetical protein EM932_11775 [Flavivirga rizhaonensis]